MDTFKFMLINSLWLSICYYTMLFFTYSSFFFESLENSFSSRKVNMKFQCCRLYATLSFGYFIDKAFSVLFGN